MDEKQRPLRLRTAQVAAAAGVEQVRLQGWLDRDNVYLDAIAGRPGKDKHRTYSLLDAIRIALIGRLVAHGIGSAKDASGLVERLLGGAYDGSFRGRAKAEALQRRDFSMVEHRPEFDKFIISTLLSDIRMYVWNDGDKWEFAWASLTKPAPWLFPEAAFHETYGLSGANPQAKKNQDTYIFIDVTRIVERIFLYLEEIGFFPSGLDVTVEDLMKNPLFEGYPMADLERAARSHTLYEKMSWALKAESEKEKK